MFDKLAQKIKGVEKQAKSPAHALQLIRAAEIDARNDYVQRPVTNVRHEPLEGNAAVDNSTPPQIHEESISASSLLPPAVRRG